MRTLATIACLAACLTATGCKNRWEWKWPRRNASVSENNGKTKTPPPTTQPVEPEITPQQEIATLQRQIKTLRERLEVIEDENARLRKSNENVQELQKALKQQTFTVKMQAEDLKVLKTAAVERDLYKTRSERLQREVRNLKAQIANLLKKPDGNRAGTNPGKAPTTKPTGT